MSKKYDAEKVQSFCDDMSNAFTAYGSAIDSAQLTCVDFSNNDTFSGEQADAAKALVGDGEISVMNEILSLNDKIKTAQDTIMEMFSAQVDAAENALIGEETLEQINADIKTFYEKHDSIGKQVEEIYDRLLEFSKYGVEFTEPDFDSGRNAFKALCGGDGEDGFIKECIQKLIDFDAEALAMLEGLGLEEEITALSQRMARASDSMNRFVMYNPLLANNMVYSSRLNGYTIGNLSYMINTDVQFIRASVHRSYVEYDRWWEELLGINAQLKNTYIPFNVPPTEDEAVDNRIEELLRFDPNTGSYVFDDYLRSHSGELSKTDSIALAEIIVAATDSLDKRDAKTMDAATEVLETLGDHFYDAKDYYYEPRSGRYGYNKKKYVVNNDVVKPVMNVLHQMGNEGDNGYRFVQRVTYQNNVIADPKDNPTTHLISIECGDDVFDTIRIDFDRNGDYDEGTYALVYDQRIRSYLGDGYRRRAYDHMNSIGQKYSDVKTMLKGAIYQEDYYFLDQLTRIEDGSELSYAEVFNNNDPEKLSDECGIALAGYTTHLLSTIKPEEGVEGSVNYSYYDEEYFSILNAFFIHEYEDAEPFAKRCDEDLTRRIQTTNNTEGYLKLWTVGCANFADTVNLIAVQGLAESGAGVYSKSDDRLINMAHQQAGLSARLYGEYIEKYMLHDLEALEGQMSIRINPISGMDGRVSNGNRIKCNIDAAYQQIDYYLLGMIQQEKEKNPDYDPEDDFPFNYDPNYNVYEEWGVEHSVLIEVETISAGNAILKLSKETIRRIREEVAQSQAVLCVDTAVDVACAFIPQSAAIKSGYQLLKALVLEKEVPNNAIGFSKDVYELLSEGAPAKPLLKTTQALCAFAIKLDSSDKGQDATRTALISVGYAFNTGTEECGIMSYQTYYELQRWSDQGIIVLYEDAAPGASAIPSNKDVEWIYSQLMDEKSESLDRESDYLAGVSLIQVEGTNHQNQSLLESGYSDEQIADALTLMLFGTGTHHRTNGNYSTIAEVPADLYVACVEILDDCIGDIENQQRTNAAQIKALSETITPAARNAGTK